MNNTLEKLSGTCLGIQKSQVIVTRNYEGLTIIYSDSGRGSKTLMAGIMAGVSKKNNLLILTETLPNHSQNLVSFSSEVFQDYRTFVQDDVLIYLNSTHHKNIFIETYEGSNKTKDQQLDDLIKLKEFCKSTGRNVYMCVPRNKVK